jgi:hypothetical protein
MSTSQLILPGTDAARTTTVIPFGRDGIEAEWRALFDRDPQANPIQYPEYVLEELRVTAAASKIQPFIVRTGTESECEAMGVLVPKSIASTKVGGIGPSWSIGGLRLVGGTFLGSNQYVETHAALLTAAMQQCRSAGADFVLIEDLDEQSALHRAVFTKNDFDFRVFAIRETQPRWRIDLPGNSEEYWKTFSSRTRYVFRKRLKRFGRTQLQRVTDIEQIPTFLADAHEISKLSWQSKKFGLRIRNDEAELQLLSVLASQGFLRSYLWYVEDKPAAFAIGHQHAGYFRYEEIAYMAEFSPLSPGVTALQQIVEDLFQFNPPTTLDFGGGDAEYKQQFGNREGCSQSVWLVPSTVRANSTLAYLNACRGIRSMARRLVTSVGLATKARQWLRYGGRAEQRRSAASRQNAAVSESDSFDQPKG